MNRIMLGMFALASYAFSTIAFSAEPPPVPVPEPGTLALLAAGIAGVVAVRLIKRK